MKTSLILFIVLLASSVVGQEGMVVGRVLDAESNEPIMSAPVYNADRTRYIMTDFDGNYSLKLPYGKHKVKCEFIGYETDSIEVEVGEQEVTVDFKLLVAGTFRKGVSVTAKAITNGTMAGIKSERDASTVTDAVTSQDMQDQGANDAAAAASKAPGVTVEGGKYVYVRGLSDRYSKTTLNGAEIPGLDPDRNSVQMDLFPSNLLNSLTVYKTFSPDLPASFTGGLVNMVTKDFPEDMIVSASVKFGFNPQSNMNNNFLGQNTAGGTDFLGFDNGSRGIPEAVLGYSTQDLNALYLKDNETLNTLGKSFTRDFDPIRKRSGFNQGYTFSIGNQKKFKKDQEFPRMGYVAGLSYRKNYSYYQDGTQGRYNLVGDVFTNEQLNAELELSDSRGDETVLWGALGNLSFQKDAYNTLGVTMAHFQNGITSTRFLEGHNYADATDLYFQTRTLQYQQRSLSTGQLKGEHWLGRTESEDDTNAAKGKLKIDWVSSLTQTTQETPELKYFTNDYTVQGNDTTYDLQPQLYSDPSQFYRLMEETNLDLKVNFELPITTLASKVENGKPGKIKWGASYVSKNRSFSERRYDFLQQSGSELAFDGGVADYLADENFDSPNFADGFIYLQDATERRNSYLGSENILAGYVMGDFYATDKIRLVVGTRVERDTIFAQSLSPALRDSVGGFDQLDVLPSLNASYSLKGDTMKLRLAYTRTLARPTFRELAPFSSFDFVGGNVYVGNRNLRRTLVDNIDLRWEYYPSPMENISAGVFAKRFTDPIERAFNPEAVNAELTWRNVDQAFAYGAEIEFRKRLDNLLPGLKGLTVGGNFTYVRSSVKIPEQEYEVILSQDSTASDERVMFGQAPYIVNAFMTYQNDSAKVRATVNFGVAGRKLAVVTTGGTPNVMENPRPELGFNISKRFGRFDQYSVKLSARNLLNSDYQQVYDFKGQEYVYASFRRGRTFSVTLRYTFDREKEREINKRLAQN